MFLVTNQTNLSQWDEKPKRLVTSERAFPRLALVACFCFRFWLVLCTVLTNQSQQAWPFIQSDTKPKPFVNCSECVFPRLVHVFSSSCDWFCALFTFIVIGRKSSCVSVNTPEINAYLNSSVSFSLRILAIFCRKKEKYIYTFARFYTPIHEYLQQRFGHDLAYLFSLTKLSDLLFFLFSFFLFYLTSGLHKPKITKVSKQPK